MSTSLFTAGAMMPTADQTNPDSTANDYQRYIRMGWTFIIGGLLTFSIWAATAPLDQGVPMSGTVTVESSRKAIQHPAGGSVEAILVREGQLVSGGEVLVRL